MHTTRPPGPAATSAVRNMAPLAPAVTSTSDASTPLSAAIRVRSSSSPRVPPYPSASSASRRERSGASSSSARSAGPVLSARSYRTSVSTRPDMPVSSNLPIARPWRAAAGEAMANSAVLD